MKIVIRTVAMSRPEARDDAGGHGCRRRPNGLTDREHPVPADAGLESDSFCEREVGTAGDLDQRHGRCAIGADHFAV